MSIKSNVRNYSLIAAFGGFVFGVDAANISGTVRYVTSQFELSSIAEGNFVSCTGLGVMLSLLFIGTLGEKFGRKNTLIGISIAYFISSIFSALAPNYWILIMGRVIGGLAFTSISLSVMYIGEITPPKTRGMYVAINQLLIVLGIFTAFLVNYYLVKAMPKVDWLTNETIWRYMFGFEIVPNIIWFSLLLILPKSPRWLISQGKVKRARQVLPKLSEAEKIEGLIHDVEESLAEERKKHLNTVMQFKIFFSKKMRFILWLGVVYAIVQSVTGINAVLFYAPTIFEQIGMSVEDAFSRTVFLSLLGVVATILAILFVEKLGRRFLTVCGLVLIVIAHTSSWYGFHSASYTITESTIQKLEEQHLNAEPLKQFINKHYSSDTALKADIKSVYSKKEIPLISGPIIDSAIKINAIFVLIGIFLFLCSFHISVGPIMWVIFSEIFPNTIRSISVPFCHLVTALATYLISQFFPWQLQNLGASTTFLYYGIASFLGLIFMFFYLPETKGKSIEEIEKLLIKS